MRGLVQTGFFKERVQMTVKSVFGMLHLLSLSFISTVYWVFTLPNTFMPPSTQVQSEILPHSGCPYSPYLPEAQKGSFMITPAWLGAAPQYVK